MKKGFTLIELMIVVAIIGVLAAVALPAYSDYVMKSREAEAINVLGDIRTAQLSYYDHPFLGNQHFATSLAALDYNLDGDTDSAADVFIGKGPAFYTYSVQSSGSSNRAVSPSANNAVKHCTLELTNRNGGMDMTSCN